MSKASYQRLEGRIEREYKRKGYSTKRASYIAHATAGEVSREKHRRNPSPPRNAAGQFIKQATRRNPATREGCRDGEGKFVPVPACLGAMKLRKPEPTPAGEYPRNRIVQYKGFNLEHEDDGHWRAGRTKHVTLRAAKEYVDTYRADHGYAGTERPAKMRRNPARKAPPSHDLFGERSHKLDIFGGKQYQAVPKAKRTAAERKAQQKRNAGQGAFDFGMTRGLFG